MTLKMAVIGVGAMGRNHVRVCNEMLDVELIAVADVDSAVAHESGRTAPYPFSLIAKAFRLATGMGLFPGVALTENFDVKSQGVHRGTSAIQHAGINLNDLDTTDLFSAVGLERPQISLAVFTG